MTPLPPSPRCPFPRRSSFDRWLLGGTGARARPARTIAVSSLLLFLGCTSATVVRKSEVPTVKTVPGEGPYTWQSPGGWIRPRRGTWGTTAEVRAESRKAFDSGAYADALDGLLVLKSRLPSTDPTLAETNFLIAECYYHLGNYDQAVIIYREVYRKNRPAQDILDRTFLRVYDIALDYLRGKVDCRFLFVNYSCPGTGIDLLIGEEGLITEYPYLTFADDALMEIATHYFDRKEYPEAVPLFQRVAEDPRSEWRELAEYQVAMSVYKQIRGRDYDQKLVLDAERRFRLYLENQPRGPQAEAARQKLVELSELQGARYLQVAKFYLNESEPRAAKIYLRLVLDRYGTSTAAREAREIQGQLDKMEGEG
jgi:outer membrane protein assembly factor BamD (BamD/ComL family)